MEQDDFERGAQEHAGVNRHEPLEVRFRNRHGARRAHFPLIPPRNAQLDEAEDCNGRKKRQIQINAQVHCSSKNSALKPGPKAAATAYSPE